ncbi:MAG: cyclic nucleotide-binding domain-containing protein [Herpetosiphon sp.]
MTHSKQNWRPSNIAAGRSELAQLDGLRKVASDELAVLASICTLRTFHPGSLLTLERTRSEMLFILLRGSVSLNLHLQSSQPALITVMGRGDVVGEGGLFGLRHRRLSARAESRVYALQMQYAELVPLLPQLPTFHKQLRRLFRERLLQTTIAGVSLFKELNAIERLAVVAQLEETSYGRGDVILRLAQTVPWVFIVAEGQAMVVWKDRPIMVLETGELFGEVALISQTEESAEVRALTPVRILSIALDTFRQLLAEHPAIGEQVKELLAHRYQSVKEPQFRHITETGVRSGLVRGAQALARIPALCPPDCRRCEQACETRFGGTRIHLNGETVGAVDLLRNCKHCAWEPECVEACPEDAFSMSDGGFLFVNDRCTGCGACAEACPYDAIDMIPLLPAVRSPVDRVRRHFQSPVPLRMQPNKCDGCYGWDNQACMIACPTSSLRWLSFKDVLPTEVETRFGDILHTIV